MELHALADDWSLNAQSYSKGLVARMYVEYFLVDIDGNFLVDIDGNFLVTGVMETSATTVLHALADDFQLTG